VANTLNVSRRTLDRRFTSLWLIDVPNTPDPNRIYDQIFIDGTYTDAGKAIYALALKLTKITTLDQARDWTLRLHDFGVVYKRFLNEKTPLPKQHRTLNKQWEWPHLRVRKAYHSLLHLSRNNWLFTYLQPPPEALEPKRWTSTTNSLEGGINAGLKRIADAHRGRSGKANAECSNGTCTRKRNCLTPH